MFSRMLQAVECHSGIPMRVVTGGVPQIPGETVYDKMVHMRDNDDQVRKLMLREPRGYPPMCTNLIVPSNNPKAEAGYIIMEQTEYPLMSGGNTISVATVLLETGMIPMQEPVTEFMLEAPAGLIGIRAECENGKVKEVTFTNVPAFAAHINAEIEVPHIGHGVEKVTVDVGWGGMMYVIVDLDHFPWVDIEADQGAEITRILALVLKAAQDQLPVSHPDYPDVDITIAQLSSKNPKNPNHSYRNTVMMPSGEIDFDKPETWTGALDRCPCGTGTCARMATLHAKGELDLNEPFYHEGILDTVYTGHLIEEVQLGEHKAVVPTIGGQAWIYGFSNYVLDPSDPFTEGYTLGDIWG